MVQASTIWPHCQSPIATCIGPECCRSTNWIWMAMNLSTDEPCRGARGLCRTSEAVYCVDDGCYRRTSHIVFNQGLVAYFPSASKGRNRKSELRVLALTRPRLSAGRALIEPRECQGWTGNRRLAVQFAQGPSFKCCKCQICSIFKELIIYCP